MLPATSQERRQRRKATSTKRIDAQTAQSPAAPTDSTPVRHAVAEVIPGALLEDLHTRTTRSNQRASKPHNISADGRGFGRTSERLYRDACSITFHIRTCQ